MPMARLTMIIELETDESYDKDAQENSKQRKATDNNTPTMADHFGERVSRALGGLRQVKQVESVLVKVVKEEGHTTLPHRKVG